MYYISMKSIWLIGAGSIAAEYAKVLDTLGLSYQVIGRGIGSARKFEERMNRPVITGGLDNFLRTRPAIPNMAIVAIGVTELKNAMVLLMEYGVRKLFVEKPGFCFPKELEESYEVASRTNSQVFFAYNRRFYSSVIKAEEIINEDGGILSFNFEFTEWGYIIEKGTYELNVLSNWFYENSTHVIDLAFFLGGKPVQLSTYTTGKTNWHNPAIFTGAGRTEKDVLFCYQANWLAPGRWGVELLTSKHRLYLRPMEKLHIQELGSVEVKPVEIDDTLDIYYKPGFYLETLAFVEGDYSRLCSIYDQKKNIEGLYNKILGK